MVQKWYRVGFEFFPNENFGSGNAVVGHGQAGKSKIRGRRIEIEHTDYDYLKKLKYAVIAVAEQRQLQFSAIAAKSTWLNPRNNKEIPVNVTVSGDKVRQKIHQWTKEIFGEHA